MPQETKQQTPQAENTLGTFFFDFLKVFVIAAAIIIPVRWFLFQPFVVTGPSMKPNFQDGDYLIIDELSYRLREPARGEVIVLRFPNDPSQFFIKRLVGLPGERVVIESGRVVIYNSENTDGLPLDESYIPADVPTYGAVDIRLGTQEYYVLGDNRLASSDSRVWGRLPGKDIIGRVYVRAFPLNKFRVFLTPVYSSG